MKNSHYTRLALIGSTFLIASTVLAEDYETNRFTFSGRFGFNISGKFKNLGKLSLNGNSRRTPDGNPYNYDDGYILPDVSGNFGGQTWNWGYDDSARQVSGDTVLLSRATSTGNSSSRRMEDDPSFGGELVYNRQLGVNGKLHWGLEAAGNYLNLSLHDRSSFRGNLFGTTDAFAFTSGTTPPGATPANPYQGTFNGPGFVIGDTPVSSTPSVTHGTVTGRRELESDIWGFRLGPYLQFPICDRLDLNFSAGLALALLNNEASWDETLTTPSANYAFAGKGHDDEWLAGGYVAANLSYQINPRWNATVGVQYQNLGTYEHAIAGRKVEIDLGSSIFLTFGVGYNF